MMATQVYADPGAVFGNPLPRICNPALFLREKRSRFGDFVLVLFLLAQCFDGVFTYVGVTTYGLAIEANPVIAGLMAQIGHGAALTGAKSMAAGLGICLHLRQVHSAVALLAVFYMVAAIIPWMSILFF